MPLFQVPSSVVDDSPGGNDSAEMFKLQNPLFQHALKEDPHFATQVKSLELMLRVRDRVADRRGGSPSRCEREAVASVSETEFCVSEGIDDVRLVSSATAGECGIVGLLEESESGFSKILSESARSTAGESGMVGLLPESESDFLKNLAGCAVSRSAAVDHRGALRRSGLAASQSDRIIGMLEVIESDFPSLSYSVDSCLGLSTTACVCASRVAAASAGAAARVCAVSSSTAVSAVAHAHASTLHGAHNSWSDTVVVQGPHGHKEGQRWGFRSG